jgi:Putative ATPase subunit of terminase (gpP-like).
MGEKREKRTWTNVRAMEPRILAMREAGMTRQEIADKLGMNKKQIKNWVCRYNRRAASNEERIPKQRGRKTAVTLADYKYENKRLKIENELLRDFLRLCGRK